MDDVSSLGGEGILNPDDLKELKEGTHRVYILMSDLAWHSPDEICLHAGKNGVPAREGLRRMRELRKWYRVDKTRTSTGRTWHYRLSKR